MIGSVVRRSWPPPKGPDLGRSSAGPHQGAAALQILCVNFYDKCLRKVMHIDFHLCFFAGLKGHMCRTVMYLVWSPPGGFFFLPPFFWLSQQSTFFIAKDFGGFFLVEAEPGEVWAANQLSVQPPSIEASTSVMWRKKTKHGLDSDLSNLRVKSWFHSSLLRENFRTAHSLFRSVFCEETF